MDNFNEEFEKEFKQFLKSIIENDVLYRELPATQRECLLRDKATDLRAIIYKYYENYNKDVNNRNGDIDIYSFLKDYVTNLEFDKRIILRYNISDIIQESEKLATYDFDEIFIEYYDDMISEIRKIILYIENLKLVRIDNYIDKINEKLAKNEKRLEESIRNNDDLSEKLLKSYELIKNMEYSVRDILPQAIAIIGIFVTILVVFFGGINLTEYFIALKEWEMYSALFIIISISHIMITSFILLFFLISRISKSSINVRCSRFIDKDPKFRQKLEESYETNFERAGKETNDKFKEKLDSISLELIKLKNDRMTCANCCFANVKLSNEKGYFGKTKDINGKEVEKQVSEEKQCGHMNRLINKYPYIFYLNVAYVFIEVFVALWWVLSVHIIKDLKITVKDPLLVSIFIIAIVMCVLTYIFLLFYQIGKSNKSFSNEYRYVIFFGGAILILGLFYMLCSRKLNVIDIINNNTNIIN